MQEVSKKGRNLARSSKASNTVFALNRGLDLGRTPDLYFLYDVIISNRQKFENAEMQTVMTRDVLHLPFLEDQNANERTMRITATAVLAFLAIAGNTVHKGDDTASSPFLPVASAYVPNNHNHHRRPGYGSAAIPNPKQNSNNGNYYNNNDAAPSSSSSAVYYRNTADVYEGTAEASYETVQERIQRVRSGHMSESEKRAYLKSALGGTGNREYNDQITAQADTTTTNAKNAASPSITGTTSSTAKAWSHPSYTPPSYITVPLGKDAQVADSKRRYLESVMDPNRFQSFGNVGRATDADAAVNTDGMSADEAELAAVQAKIARIEEEKKRIAAEAKEKVSYYVVCM